MKIETPVLRRLGPVPFWRGSERVLDALESAYARASAKARALLSKLPPQDTPARPHSKP